MKIFIPGHRTLARFLSTFLTVPPPPPSTSLALETISSYLYHHPTTSLSLRYSWLQDILAELEHYRSSTQLSPTHLVVRLSTDSPPHAYLLGPDLVPLPSPPSLGRELGALLAECLGQNRAEEGFPPVLASVIRECMEEKGASRRTPEDVGDILFFWRRRTRGEGSVDWDRMPPWLPSPSTEEAPSGSSGAGDRERKSTFFLPRWFHGDVRGGSSSHPGRRGAVVSSWQRTGWRAWLGHRKAVEIPLEPEPEPPSPSASTLVISKPSEPASEPEDDEPLEEEEAISADKEGATARLDSKPRDAALSIVIEVDEDSIQEKKTSDVEEGGSLLSSRNARVAI